MKIFVYMFASVAIMSPLFAPQTTLLRADDQSDRARLDGSWVESGGSRTWVIQSASGGVHMTETEGSVPVADFQCNVEGQNCNVKISGHKAQVSMYYNGSALVQLTTIGEQIVKRRFSLLPSGNMRVEVTPMTGKSVQTEDVEFVRSNPVAAK